MAVFVLPAFSTRTEPNRIQLNQILQSAPPSAYGPTVDLLCSWGQHEHLLGAVVDSLKRAFSEPAAATIGSREGHGAGHDDDDSAASEAGVLLCMRVLFFCRIGGGFRRARPGLVLWPSGLVVGVKFCDALLF